MNNLLLKQKEILNTIPSFDEHILFSLERRYFEFLDMNRLELCYNPSASNFELLTDLRMIKMNEVNHEGDPDMGIHLMQFQNVLAALHDNSHAGEPSHNVVSMIHNYRNNTSLYYGIAKRKDHASDVGTGELFKLLGRSIHGNFLGARFSELSAGEMENGICNPLNSYNYITAFPGIPSTRDKHGPYVQGIDRFIEAMRGEEYALLCIAEPVKLAVLDGMISNLFGISAEVHSQVKATIQNMKGSSDTVNMGMFGMKGTMDSVTDSTSDTTGGGDAKSFMGAGGIAGGIAGVVGGIAGTFLIPIPGVGTAIGATVGTAIGTVGGALFGLPMSTSTSTMHSFTRSIANTVGSTMGGGGFGGYARGWNRSKSATQEVLNKTAEHCEKLCDAYISRLQRGKNLGMWNVGVYLLAKDRYTQQRGQGLLRACMAGDETYWEPIRALPLQDDAAGAYLVNFNNPRYNLLRYGSEQREVKEAVGWGSRLAGAAKRFTNGSIEKLLSLVYEAGDTNSAALLEEIRRSPASYSEEALRQAWKEVESRQLGHPLGPAMGGVSTPMNTEELSIVMNIPRREVQGVTIRETAEFGINYSPDTAVKHVELGKFIHKRQVMKDLSFTLPVHLFQKHALVCGVTGSGKTNTCFTLLKKLGLPFLVVEPAKGEYRRLLRDIPDLRVFTLGDETISPFRLNPFEFDYSAEVRDGRLMFHIDTVKSAFNASFPMYGPMAYILEDAILSIYRDKGWDLAVSENVYLKKNDPAERMQRFHDYLPTLRELHTKVKETVKQKRYAPEQAMNIEAALKSRLSSLLTGSKGLMLDCKRSTPMDELLNSKVVLELKHMGDDEEKCFIMGLILSRIYAHREAEGHSGSKLRHIILVEEAHRLLKKMPDFVSPEIGNSRGKAVETFCNVISEIRDFGEGVIIVDQIPGKLADDAVKNTSLKIVHRILAGDDRETLGAAMSLTPEQNRELPLLPVGTVVAHSEGADKPFLVSVEKSKDQDGAIVTDDMLRDTMKSVVDLWPQLFVRYPGFEKSPVIPELFRNLDFEPLRPELYALIIAASAFIVDDGGLPEHFRGIANSRIKAVIRCDDAHEADCFVIWNTNLFFQKLNESYPRTIDYCLDAQQTFIDLWFDTPQSPAGTEGFRVAMRSIVRDRAPLSFLAQSFLWYLKTFSPSGHAELMSLAARGSARTPEVDALLSRLLWGAAPGAAFADALMNEARLHGNANAV